jgi:hypothetical protein
MFVQGADVFVSMKHAQTIRRRWFGPEVSRVAFAFPGDLTKQTTVSCLACGRGYDLVKKTESQVMLYLFEHCREFHGLAEPRSNFDVGSDFGVSKAQTTSPRAVPLFWERNLVQDLFSEQARANMQEKDGRICLSCLNLETSVRDKNFACCLNKIPKTVKLLRVAHARSGVVIDDGIYIDILLLYMR